MHPIKFNILFIYLIIQKLIITPSILQIVLQTEYLLIKFKNDVIILN